jgi:hypothetical protein
LVGVDGCQDYNFKLLETNRDYANPIQLYKKCVMTIRKKLIFTAISYFLNILLFALIYWGFWANNPSNFIVNEEYNEQTVNPFLGYINLPDSNTTSIKMMTARETNDKIKPFYDTIESLSQKQKHVDERLFETKILDSLNQSKLMKSFDKNFDVYLAKLLSHLNKTKDSIESAIYNYEKQKVIANPNNGNFYQFDVEMAKLNVMLANNDVAINLTKYNAYDKSIKSMPLFYDDTLYQNANILYKKIDSLEKRKRNLLEEIRDNKEKIWLIAIDYYRHRVIKLNFFDFLYFSIITATSTGYGDILPNNSTIRILVSIEILSSLFLFGLFFNFVSQQSAEDKKD